MRIDVPSDRKVCIIQYNVACEIRDDGRNFFYFNFAFNLEEFVPHSSSLRKYKMIENTSNVIHTIKKFPFSYIVNVQIKFVLIMKSLDDSLCLNVDFLTVGPK